MHVSVVQEVDVPDIGTGGQRAVLGVGRGAAEADDVARPEQLPSVGDRMVATGRVPALTVSGAEIVEFTPSDTVSRTW